MRPGNLEDTDISENFVEMEQVDEEGTQLYNGVKLGEYWSTDIQVAINEGNRRRDAFFMIRVGKVGTSMPFQQPIPSYFAKYHPELHLKNITLEVPSGRSWEVVVRAHSDVMRFGKGWKEFSVENNLREGCQLLFTLVGKAHFMVKFFDNLGKSHDSFPPLPDAVQSLSLPRDEEHAIEPPLEPALATSSANPATSLARAPEGRHGALNSHFLPQPHLEVPNSKTTVPNEDMPDLENDAFHARSAKNGEDMETEHEGQAVAEGKNYMDLDSDDELGYPEALFTPVKQNVPKGNVQDIDLVMKNKDDEFHSGDQSGFQSPGKAHTVSRGKNVNHLVPDNSQEHDAEMHHDSEEDEHFTASKSSSDDDDPLQRHHRQRQVQMKVSMKRPSLQGEGRVKGKGKVQGKGKAASSAGFFTLHDHIRNLREEAATRRSSERGNHGGRDTSERREAQKRNVVPEEPMERLNPATRLLRQQGCAKFSQIVSKCNRRHVNDQERTSVENAAKRFALGLENEKFLVLMRDAQVYHGFQLALPDAILEATGTLRANKVQAHLMHEQENLYAANWARHSLSESAVLNSDGWAKFALDHTIEEGDVCVFELSNSGPAFISGFLFCVHIFRVAETPGKEDSSIRELRGAQTPLNNTS